MTIRAKCDVEATSRRKLSLLDHAAGHGYALPAFNVNNMEQIHAILNAARGVKSPAILAEPASRSPSQ